MNTKLSLNIDREIWVGKFCKLTNAHRLCYESKALKMKLRFVFVPQVLELSHFFFIQSCEGLFCPVGTRTRWSQTDGSPWGVTLTSILPVPGASYPKCKESRTGLKFLSWMIQKLSAGKLRVNTWHWSCLDTWHFSHPGDFNTFLETQKSRHIFRHPFGKHARINLMLELLYYPQ